MTRTQEPTPAVHRRPWLVIPVGAAVVALANVVVFALGRLAGASFVLYDDPAAPHAVGLVDVLVSSVVPLVLGTGFAVLLGRWWRHALRAGQVVGAGLAVLSTAGPLTALTDTGTAAALAVMHLLVGVAVVAILAPLHARRARA
jgi:ABC-type transport system involved in cytochrome c biogenesis permease subunit